MWIVNAGLNKASSIKSVFLFLWFFVNRCQLPSQVTRKGRWISSKHSLATQTWAIVLLNSRGMRWQQFFLRHDAMLCNSRDCIRSAIASYNCRAMVNKKWNYYLRWANESWSCYWLSAKCLSWIITDDDNGEEISFAYIEKSQSPNF